MLDRTFWNNKRVLITGGTGFIGSWMCMMLLELGADVSTVSRSGGSPDGLFISCDLGSKVKVVKGDVRDKELIFNSVSSIRPQIVFHLAAQPIYSVANEHPYYTYETNILGTLNVIEACQKNDVERIVFVTSEHWDGKAIDNISIYASSKACSEIVIRSLGKLFHGEKPHMSIVRMLNTVGGGDCETSRIIPYCLDRLNSSSEIQLKRPEAYMRFIYVLDAVTMLILLAQKNDDRIWNLSDVADESITVKEVKDCIIKKYGTNPDIEGNVYRELKRAVAVSDGEAVSFPKTSFEDAMQDVVYVDRIMKNPEIVDYCRSLVSGYIEHELDE